VFDILQIAGDDVRTRTLLDRKALLKATLAGKKRIRYVDHIAEQGIDLFNVADKLGLEGIVAKRADAPYPRGRSLDRLGEDQDHARPAHRCRAGQVERTPGSN